MGCNLLDFVYYYTQQEKVENNNAITQRKHWQWQRCKYYFTSLDKRSVIMFVYNRGGITLQEQPSRISNRSIVNNGIYIAILEQ